MTNIIYSALMAELAEASYADLRPGNTVTTELERIDFSGTQASKFDDKWFAVSGSHQEDTSSGFSATVFQGKSEAEDLSGEYVLAIRGTAGLADLSTDSGDIVLDGLAVDQIIDLYNYTLELTTDGNYQAAKLVLVAEADGISSGTALKILAKDSGQLFLKGLDNPFGAIYTIERETRDGGPSVLPAGASLHVTGHSLGGHLAAAFSRLFPAMTSNVTMINGAGFSDGLPLIANNFNITNMFSMLGGASSFNSGIINNYIGTAGWDFISQDWFIGLQQPGNSHQIFTESFSGLIIGSNTTGHGSSQMTNVLSIMSLFDRLDTTNELTNIQQFNDLFLASAEIIGQTFERVMNDLAKLFNVEEIEDLDADSTTDGREALFSRIKQIEDAIKDTSDTKLISLVNRHFTELKVKALGLVEPENALAYRYSLVNLTPFVVTGDNTIYQNKHNQNGELDLYDEETGLGELTETYIEKRAEFLMALIERNQQDIAHEDETDISRKVLYDLEAGIRISKRQTQNEHLAEKIIFGSESGETIEGSHQTDYLFGMGGNDIIHGGNATVGATPDSDYIEGGDGDDDLHGMKLMPLLTSDFIVEHLL